MINSRKRWNKQVLNAGDEAGGVEQLEEDVDDITQLAMRRSMGSMSAMSGSRGMVYMEYRSVCISASLYNHFFSFDMVLVYFTHLEILVFYVFIKVPIHLSRLTFNFFCNAFPLQQRSIFCTRQSKKAGSKQASSYTLQETIHINISSDVFHFSASIPVIWQCLPLTFAYHDIWYMLNDIDREGRIKGQLQRHEMGTEGFF